MRRILLPLAMASVILVSCSSVKRASSAKTIDIYGPGVVHLPVVADLVVNENKITGTKIGNTSQQLGQLKAEAVNAALKTVNGDVLVEPNFQIETVGSRVTVTVTGRAGFYKNFRQMQEIDTNLLKTILRQRPTIIEPGEEKKKRKYTPMVTGTAPAPILTSGNVLVAGVYFYEKYPQLKFAVTSHEVEKLIDETDQSSKKPIGPDHKINQKFEGFTTLEKLLIATLWKTGHINIYNRKGSKT